mmetsp:Transcript_32957/g.52794  ORF Transcript_32957/g.52794 Transcript_32957/m.52794 type:complete len:108 (+) Transcript_32957:217-540(+)
MMAVSIPALLARGLPLWATVVAAVVARGAAMAASALTWIVTPEGYHTEVRATGHSWGNMMARAGALGATYWGGINMPELVKAGSYVLMALAGLAAAVALPDGVNREP